MKFDLGKVVCEAPVESHPSRGAWIEMERKFIALLSRVVAPLTGCVD